MTLDEQFLQHLGGVRTNSLRELLQVTNVGLDEENMHSLIPHSPYVDTDQICKLATSKQVEVASCNIESLNATFGKLEIFVE